MGDVVSKTSIVCSIVDIFPEISITSQVTIVLPSSKVLGASFVIDAISTWSDASANP